MKRVCSGEDVHAATYADRLFSREIPKYRLPEESMPADAAYRLVADELNLDGNPALNLASFVTTWMEPEADRLGAETANRNLIDQEEYPRTQVIHQRMVSMVASLFNAPPDATGTARLARRPPDLGRAAGPRLDRSRLHAAGQRRAHRRAADGGPGELQPGHGRAAAGRPAQRRRPPLLGAGRRGGEARSTAAPSAPLLGSRRLPRAREEEREI